MCNFRAPFRFFFILTSLHSTHPLFWRVHDHSPSSFIFLHSFFPSFFLRTWSWCSMCCYGNSDVAIHMAVSHSTGKWSKDQLLWNALLHNSSTPFTHFSELLLRAEGVNVGMPFCGCIFTLWSAVSNVNSVKPEQTLVSIDLLKSLMAFLWGTAVWCKWKSRNVILNTNVRFKKKKYGFSWSFEHCVMLIFLLVERVQSLILYPTQTALIS